MSYKILLFDLDDTLLDFGANEIDSLNKLFHQNGYTFSIIEVKRTRWASS